MLKVTADNALDIAESLHVFLTVNHEGQDSNKYWILCKSQFTPGPMWSEARFLLDPPIEYDWISSMDDTELDTLMDSLNTFLGE